MTRYLTRLADIAYRRRGRVVAGWIVAMIVIIGVGSSLKGEFNADYNTPGSESKAASDITQQRFGGYSGQEIYVVWRDPAGVRSPAAQQRMNAFFAQAEKVNHISNHTGIRVSQNGQYGTTTLPLTVPGWDVTKDQGKQLIDAAQANAGNGLEIKLGGDPIQRAESQASPEGIGLFAAAIVLLIAFGSVVAAGLPLGIALAGLGISSAGLIPLLANVIDVPNWTTAVSGLIGIGVGIDYSLLVLTRFRTAMREGKGRHDAVVEAVTTAGRSVIIAGCTVVIAVLGLFLTGLSYMYGVALSAAIAVLVMMLASITRFRRCSPTSARGSTAFTSRSSDGRCATTRAARSRRRLAGATWCSGIPGRRRSSRPPSCSPWRRPHSACGWDSRMRATTRRTR